MYEKVKQAVVAYTLFLDQIFTRSLTDFNGEVWAWIEGYEGRYQISNFGRVKSFNNGSATILKPNLHPQGYLTVSLCKANKKRTAKVHRLVARAFVPNPEGKPEVHHKDGNKLNNHVSNLIWCTRDEHLKLERERAMRDAGVEIPKTEPDKKVNAADNVNTDYNALEKTFYSDQPILTTAQIAQFYGCTTDNIKVNFNNHSDKFVEGKHYFKLEGAALKAFKNEVNDVYLVGKNASVLYLWTKRGCARHAKMLNTEMAWQVFEELEDAYFTLKENPVQNKKTASTLDLEKQLSQLGRYIDMTDSANLRDNLIKLYAELISLHRQA